jgi:hypothetical protein
MQKLFAIALALFLAVGLSPARANCGPAHPCEGAYCQE